MNAFRVASNADLLEALMQLRAEAKTYNYGRSTIQTGIKSILDDSRYRVIVEDVQALNSDQPRPFSDIAYRFISKKRFDYRELSRLLQLDDQELSILLTRAAGSAASLFN
jgi:hypothetical protein